MDNDELAEFERLISEPGPREEEFFALRRLLQLGAGLDVNEQIVVGAGHAFVAFRFSKRSPKARPSEVGVAWWDTEKITIHSKLTAAPVELQAECISHTVSENADNLRVDLEAQNVDDVATWWLKTVGERTLISETPDIGQGWLSELLGEREVAFHDFGELARRAFSDEGCFNAGQLGVVNAVLSERKAYKGAGEDAAALCQAWQTAKLARKIARF
ncbi:hypothetical protein KL867_19320 [Ruegeria litorea]|uniref:Uncharacterized protein n=1 Tax=Falsiruegeria litorea TaxID=1280831 RepID=A0ABS5WVZ2_9RHOB|nr:hypothetical protein [Falsiruegeria litorea]MBT3143220.1 hypothetical protein [Falsiruegeria litorea]